CGSNRSRRSRTEHVRFRSHGRRSSESSCASLFFLVTRSRTEIEPGKVQGNVLPPQERLLWKCVEPFDVSGQVRSAVVFKRFEPMVEATDACPCSLERLNAPH